MIRPTRVDVQRASSVHRRACKLACEEREPYVFRAGNTLLLAVPNVHVGKPAKDGQVYEWPACSSAAVARVAENTARIISLGSTLVERISIAIEHAEAARWAAARRERKHC